MTQQQLDLINQQQLNQSTSTSLAGYRIGVRAPRLHQQPGPAPGTVVITMDDPSRGASIFYTEDGWTPTPASQRYLGPVTISNTETIRAIAFTGGSERSFVTTYPILLGTKLAAAPTTAPVQISNPTQDTLLPLAFSAPVTSAGLKIGDALPVTLAADVFINGKPLAARGTKVETLVTEVDNAHREGLPSVLSFAVRSMPSQDGKTLELTGVETIEGVNHMRRAAAFSVIPFGGVAVHGRDATIPQGARFNAHLVPAAVAQAEAKPIE